MVELKTYFNLLGPVGIFSCRETIYYRQHFPKDCAFHDALEVHFMHLTILFLYKMSIPMCVWMMTAQFSLSTSFFVTSNGNSNG